MGTNSAAHWLTHAETEARKAQQALGDLDSLNLPPRWGELDVARQRGELITARDEYLRDAVHWRRKLDQQRLNRPLSI
jgi:hypothetical protein